MSVATSYAVLEQVKLVLLNTSVVVLAEAHNPTILHPFFLRSQKIVPENWAVADNPVCTPAISVVKYVNNVIFTAEPNKVMVLDSSPTEKTQVPNLILNYVEALPHVRYSAVGVNFSGFIACPSPEQWLMQRFLREGAGNNEQLKPSAFGLKLVYPVETGVLTMSFEAGSVEREPNVSSSGLLVNGNYHWTTSAERHLEQIRSAIRTFQDRFAHFKELTDTILGINK